MPSGGGTFELRLARFWFVLLMPGIVAVQRDIDRRISSEVTRLLELQVWSGDAIRRMAPGLEDVLADIYWLRTVQYYGGERNFNPESRFALLQPLVEITTALDPRLQLAYRYGAVFLAEPHPVGAGQPDVAVALLVRGVEQNPESWRLAWDLGYFRYFFLKDTNGAIETLLEASKVSGAPTWLATLAGSMAAKGGERETARELWLRIHEESDAPALKANALFHLQFLAALDLMDLLDAAIAAYREQHGGNPEQLSDLVAAGKVKAVPTDPTGLAFGYDAERGKVFLQRASKLWSAQSEEKKREAL